MAVGPARGGFAVIVIDERDADSGGILVEQVHAVEPAHREMAGQGIGVAVAGHRGQLRGVVVGEVPGHVAGSARQVVVDMRDTRQLGVDAPLTNGKDVQRRGLQMAPG